MIWIDIYDSQKGKTLINHSFNFGQYTCYNLRLGLGCNLDKYLSKRIGMSQLVKYKDTRLYLQLYILIDHESNVWLIYVMISQNTKKQKGNNEETTPTT